MESRDMKRVATWIILTMAAAALLLAMLPSMPVQADVPIVKYQVSYSEDSRTFSVSMSFRASHESTSLYKPYRLDQWGSGPNPILPSDYFIIKEASASQGPVSITPTDRGWDINGQGEISINYQVDLNTLSQLSPTLSGVDDPSISPFLPHVGSDYLFVPDYCLFLEPILDNTDSEISFSWPEGWEALPSQGVTVPPGTMGRGGIFAGKASTVYANGDTPLTVVQPQDADPANLAGQQEFADKLAAQFKTANEAWGNPGFPSRRLDVYLGGVAPDGIDNQRLLSIPFDPLYGCVFVPVGASENILSTDFLLRAGDESMRELLWDMSLDPSALWFREGCIHYSNLRFAQRNQWISEDDVFNQLGQDYAIYVDSLARSGTSPAGAGDQALQEPMAGLLYGGGTIAVTSIDARLAEKGKTLDEFITGLLQKKPEGGITNQYLQDELKAYSGEDFSAFFKDYITGDKVIPASSFSQLKLNQGSSEGANASNAGQNDIKPAPGFGSKWIMIIIAILIVFALPFLLEPYTLRPRGGSEPFDHDVEGKKKSGGRWWSWDEEEEEDEAKDLEDDAGGGEEEKAPGPEGGTDDPEVESVEAATPLPPEL